MGTYGVEVLKIVDMPSVAESDRHVRGQSVHTLWRV